MTTAFFYQQPEVLDRGKHQNLKLCAITNARFAAEVHNVPVVAAEFVEAALEYPLVFVKADDDQWMAMASTGLNPPIEATQSVKVLLESFQAQTSFTHAFAQCMSDVGLLMEARADLNEPDGSTQRLHALKTKTLKPSRSN